jgi:hypothetical protein
VWKRKKKQVTDNNEKKPKKGRIKRFLKRAILWSYLGCAAIGLTTDIIAHKLGSRKFDPLVKQHIEKLKEGDFASRLERKLIKRIARLRGIKPESLEGKIKIKDKEWMNERLKTLEFGETARTSHNSFDLVWRVMPEVFDCYYNKWLTRSVGILIYPYYSTGAIFLNSSFGVSIENCSGSETDFQYKKIYIFPLGKLQFAGDERFYFREYYESTINHELFHFLQRNRSKIYKEHEMVEFFASTYGDYEKPRFVDKISFVKSDTIDEWVKRAPLEVINYVLNDYFSAVKTKKSSANSETLE